MSRLAFVLALLAAGCSNKSDKPEAIKREPVVAKPEPTKPKLTAAWLGKVVAPPGVLGKLTLESPIEEAKRLVAFADSPSMEASELEGVSYGVQKTLDGKRVGDLIVTFPPEQKAVVAEAWGPGADGDRGGRSVTVWFNPDLEVRATLTLSRNAELRFEHYLPLAKLLGEGPEVAVFSKPFLGLTGAEAHKNYAGVSDGKALSLPPTEWEFGGSTLAFFYPGDADKPVKSLSVSFPFDNHGGGVEELRAAFEKKWGKPKGKNPIDDKSEIYNKARPHIEIADHSYGTKQLTITISEK